MKRAICNWALESAGNRRCQFRKDCFCGNLHEYDKIFDEPMRCTDYRPATPGGVLCWGEVIEGEE